MDGCYKYETAREAINSVVCIVEKLTHTPISEIGKTYDVQRIFHMLCET